MLRDYSSTASQVYVRLWAIRTTAVALTCLDDIGLPALIFGSQQQLVTSSVVAHHFPRSKNRRGGYRTIPPLRP